MTSAASILALCCLAVTWTLASAASSTPPPSMRGGSRLARLLTEAQPPRLLTKSECNALPVNFGASENQFGTAHCPGMMYMAPGAGYNNAQGVCLFWADIGAGSYADAQAACTSMDAGAVLWSPRDDAERCLLTDAVGFTGGTAVSGITDAQTEGEYVDQDGFAIPDVYMNWFDDPGQPLEPNGGAAENCVVFASDNEGKDASCDSPGSAAGRAFCIKRLPAV